MSRKKESNDIMTKHKQVRFGKRVLRGPEPVALVGPEQNKDTLSAGEFVEQLYGPGYQCVIIPPADKAVNM